MGKRLVIDSNQLQSPRLRAYLAKRADHYAVLTDYVAMEAYQVDPSVRMRERMAILGEFPRQVLVLKFTREVCGLRGRQAGLPRRMIDETQSREFVTYSRLLMASGRGAVDINDRLERLGAEARQHLATMLRTSEGLPMALHELSQTYWGSKPEPPKIPSADQRGLSRARSMG